MPSLKLISDLRDELVVPCSQPSMKVMVGHNRIKVLAILLFLGMELNSMVLLKVMFKSTIYLEFKRRVFHRVFTCFISFVEFYLNVFRGPLFISQEFKCPHMTKIYMSQKNRSNMERNVGKISFIFLNRIRSFLKQL